MAAVVALGVGIASPFTSTTPFGALAVGSVVANALFVTKDVVN